MIKYPTGNSEYLNEDGTKKPNPYIDKEGHTTDGPSAVEWARKQNEILLSLMNEDERKAYLERLSKIKDRWDSESSVGAALDK